MSFEDFKLQDLSISLLAESGNPNCVKCVKARQLGADVIDELPAREDIEAGQVVARFAGFAALCPREAPIPPAVCVDGQCGVISDERKCQFLELLNMSPDERMKKIQEIAGA